MANLKFTSSGSTTIQLVAVGTPLTNNFTANSSAYTLGTVISLSDGDELTFAGSTNDFSLDSSNYYKFVIGGTGTVTIEGDLISLTNNNPYIKQYQFYNLFKGCSQITSISDLAFPSTIADWCYANMFMDCTGLVDAGTTLPATYTSVWCYEGMFARCTSLITPPAIMSEQLAPFCYYGMFQGCSSLTDGPQLRNKIVSGDFSTNIMFKDCTSLSTIQVAFTDWPSGGTWSRKWLNNVSPNGVFVYPTTLPVSAIEATSAVPAGWSLSSTYPAQIIVSDQSFEFDAMSNTYQYKSFTYSYNGEDTLNVSVDTSNKPSWLLYQVLSNNTVYFTAQGYQIDSSATVQIPITFTASDAATKIAIASFTVENYPVNQITVNTIPTFSFDAESQTDIVSSLLDYVTYGGSTLSCTVTGELPTGLSCVNGVITGTPSQFTNNYSGSFNIEYSAQDSRPVVSSVNVEIINAAPVYVDYSTMPLTLKANGPIGVQLKKNGNGNNNSTIYYSKNNGEWTLWKDSNADTSWVELAANDTLQLSGSTSGFNTDQSNNNYFGIAASGEGTFVAYGNVHSLINYSNYSTQVFGSLFRACEHITDASNLYLPPEQIANGCYRRMFLRCYNLTDAPKIRYRTYNRQSQGSADGWYAAMFSNCTSLTSIEVDFDWWDSNGNTNSNWLYNVPANGVFIKPGHLAIQRGASYIPDGWTVQIGTDKYQAPITFEALDGGSGKIKMFMVNGSNSYTFYYKKSTDADWTLYTNNNTLPEISYAAGQSVSFSGTNSVFNTGWGSTMHSFSGSVPTKVWGRVDSLIGYNQSSQFNNNNVFAHAFNADYNYQTWNTNILNMRDLYLPWSNYSWYDGFARKCANQQLSAGPIFDWHGTNNTYGYFFQGCTKLKVFELTSLSSYAFNSNSFSEGVPASAVCILPSGFNYWGNGLNSNTFRYVYRNRFGIFSGSTQIDEEYLLETGNLRALA